ncbi:hypothetical protein ADUPG1_011126, partial [Aduncisulcus paluster]
PVLIATKLISLMEQKLTPKISTAPLFRSLKTIEGGKFKPVHECLNEVFQGLTQVDVEDRMKVHSAREKVQSIKHLLPKIGEGWECPSIDDIVETQLEKHGGDPGSVFEGNQGAEEDKLDSLQSVKQLRQGWDDSVMGHVILPSEEKQIIPSSSSSKSQIRSVVDASDLEVLIKTIKKSPDSDSTSEIYREHRESILSVFLASQSKREIKAHKREIILSCQCLRWFVRHSFSGKKIFLPILELNNLVNTFFDHWTRVEKVLEGEVEEAFCSICVSYSFKVQDEKDSFLPKVSSIFERILERGSKKKLEGDVPLDLLSTLRNISLSPSPSTQLSILTLIKPYIKHWLTIERNNECYGRWVFILSNITYSVDDNSPNKAVCSEAWSLFSPVLDIVKEEFIGEKLIEDDHEEVLRFFSNLCCNSSHAIKIYDSIKQLLSGWFETIHKKKHEWGIKYWSELLLMLSTVPSLVPHISPKYDGAMEWCKENGIDVIFISYFCNCYPHLKKWIDLIDSIKKCSDSESTSILYQKHRKDILSAFVAVRAESEIKEHRKEIVLCVQCLKSFVNHAFSKKNEIFLPIPDLNDLVDTFIDHLSRVEGVLEEDVDEDYCEICAYYTSRVKDKRASFLPKIVSTFQRILERGSEEKLEGSVALQLLNTLKNISISPSSSQISMITLIKPYIRRWFTFENNSACYGRWMFILSNITFSQEDNNPNKSLCSMTWSLFNPVLDIVKTKFVGDKIVGDDHEEFLRFFSNLCCEPSHALKIFDNIKDLLSGWFETIKKMKNKWGIKFWCLLISMLSTVPSLVPHLSPRYDTAMKWCKDKGALSSHYLRYCGNYELFLENWEGLVTLIQKCSSEKEKSKLYHEYQDHFSAVLLRFQSKPEILKQKTMLLQCCQCLRLFVKHVRSSDGTEIYLPLSDLNDLIDTFIDHLSRVEEALKEAVDGEYCRICVDYTFKIGYRRCDRLIHKISAAFQRMIERDIHSRLSGDIPLYILKTLRNISISSTNSTASSILSLIKPFIMEAKYREIMYFQRWIFIIAKITWSSEERSPNPTICSEAWPLFRPIFNIVSSEFVMENILENECYYLLRFFSNICCDPLHAVDVHNKLKYLLDGWFENIKKKKHNMGIKYWAELVSILSLVPALVPHLSPKYDRAMKWCKENACWPDDYTKYQYNRRIMIQRRKDEGHSCGGCSIV